MASSEADLDSPAIIALGSHFKLTEVFLWDDGFSSDIEQASLFPKHIRFKYDGDDNEDDDSTRERSSNTSLETAEDSVVTEDVELTQQMSALGLPLSFQTSKLKSGQTKVKSKATKLGNKHNQKRSEDQVQGSSRVGEESSCLADSQDKSTNSSLSSVLHQTELSCSGGDACVDLPALDLPVELGTEPVHPLEERVLERNNIFDDSVERNAKDVDKRLTEQVDTESAEIGKNIMQIEDPGSRNTIEQAQVADLSGGSLNMLLASNCASDDIRCSGSNGDWNACWDSFYTRYYFYNAKTQESTWYPPPGMENFALGDYSCASSESKAELNEVNEEILSFEKEQVDRRVLVYETGSDEQTGGETGSVKHCQSLKQETEEVNGSDMCHGGLKSKDLESTDLPDFDSHYRHFDGSIVVELSSANSSTSAAKAECNNDDIHQTHQEEIETMVDDFDMQNTAVSTKRKKTRKTRRRKKSSNDNDDKGCQLVQDFHVDVTKYWNQRYLLFSKYDYGIKMDEEGWFSVTPEAIAKHHASRSGGGIVIDCFAGVGGNAIQFAKVSKQVMAIDIDSTKIDYAHHNAVIYGVEEKIDFVRGDSFALAPKLIADTVFLSPPWGGPDYVKMDSYGINMLLPCDGHCLFNTFKTVASKIVMFLPRNVNVIQLAELSLNADTKWSLEVEKNFLNGKLKAVTAYYSKISV